MLINHEIWQNLSLWNEMRNTYGNYKLFIDFKVVIEKKRRSTVNISSDRLYRLQLMKSLKDMVFLIVKYQSFSMLMEFDHHELTNLIYPNWFG